MYIRNCVIVANSQGKQSGRTMGQKKSLIPETKSGKEEIKRFHGDGLHVDLDSNNRILEVTGDGCKIHLTKNCGSVRIVGDGCHLKIAHNVGDVEYTGDGGRVLLGPNSSKKGIRFIGDGGKVTFDSTFKNCDSEKNSPKGRTRIKLTNFDGNSLCEYTVTKKNCHSANSEREKTRDRDSSVSKKHFFESKKSDEKSDSASEEKSSEKGKEGVEKLENFCNARRETKRASRKGRKGNVIVTTKIITSSEDYQTVKTWFVKPSAFIKSLDESAVKIVAKN